MAMPLKKNENLSVLTEYSIYIHHRYPSKHPDGEGDWEKKTTTTNKHRALAQAQKLYASNDYHKVEVKKKISDPANDRAFDMTLKVYKRSKKIGETKIITALIVGILLGAGCMAGIILF